MNSGTLLARPELPASYLRKIWDYPMLSADEEIALARAWRDDNDVDASHKLVTSHLRLVTKVATKYRGYGLPSEDLVSEGAVGLMQAVKRFDPDRGFRLSTYAIWWIRAAIQEYILHSWSLVKIGTTAAQKKLFFNLNRLKGQMRAIDDGDLRPEQAAKIASLLDVAEEDVVNMNRRMAAHDHSLNAPTHEYGSDWQDGLVDESAGQESAFADHEELVGRKARLSEVMKVLNTRERHILIERRLKDNPSKLDELSQHYGISRERVRQIEVRAVEKLRKAMTLGGAGDRATILPPTIPAPHAYGQAALLSSAHAAFEVA
jgi:RNA polymerase sigma-32 factor